MGESDSCRIRLDWGLAPEDDWDDNALFVLRVYYAGGKPVMTVERIGVSQDRLLRLSCERPRRRVVKVFRRSR